MAEHQIVRKHPNQDEKDAWDAYASAALSSLVAIGSEPNKLAASKAAQFATLLLNERRELFPEKKATARSVPLKL
ncbi:hypothetical protein PSFL_23880 [Pseudomonas sp. DD1]|uniref:hypothetical protein n=1 Tax=unclassified Pseudomonas TaxID=196821 RepID=UPI0014737ABC|nr:MULTISPECIES: hypothetical protein [unclassified Pseudomonas]MBJ2254809.1 hypothetical protein [Pseudomonas sp. MF6784]NMX94275.1 hypothetical protein [Pseudomonas sp. WS 5086]NMY32917.1 hypothetical protein [Pseudomonas sp. WS 5412]NMY48121.1 hypothetical protein [Pseudomonas sp. WS 5027]